MEDRRCKSIVYQCILSNSLVALFQVKNATFSLHIDRTQEVARMEITSTDSFGTEDKVINCQYENCRFPPEGGGQCAGGNCICSDKCSVIVAQVVEDVLSGTSATMSISDNEMSFDVKGSPIPISGYNCYASDCVLYPEFVVTNETRNETNHISDILDLESTVTYDDPLSKETILSAIILTAIFAVILLLTCATYIAKPLLKFFQKKDQYSSSTRTENESAFNQNSSKIDHYQEEQVRKDSTIERKNDEPGNQYLHFSHLNVDLVERNKRKKTILNDISGCAYGGQILGIMGPSGGGKTTLLNVLAGGVSDRKLRQTDGYVRVVNGAGNNGAFVAHVPQDDVLYETLTVRESVEYSALLRLPKATKEEEKQQQVDSILKELNLDGISNSRIGGRGAGISGGERKRVSIGMELVTVTSLHSRCRLLSTESASSTRKDNKENNDAQTVLLILDEPTSGLDSFAANQLITTLSKLASSPFHQDKKCIVILSIHQPPLKVFHALDRILLLSSEGQVVYHGNSSDARNHFDINGFQCDVDSTIAELMLEVVMNESKSKVGELVAVAKSHNESISSEEKSNANAIEKQKNYDRISIFQEITILYARTFTNIFRNKSMFILQLIISILVALGVSGLFHDITDNLAGFQNRSGAFYFTLTFFAFTSFSSIDTFLHERIVFLRESGNQYYNVFSYFLVKTTLDAFLLRVIPVTVYTFVIYWILGLKNTLEAFLLFWTALVVFNMCAGIMTTCISVATFSVGQANLIAAVWFLIMLLFGGFLVNLESIDPGFAWLKYLSIFYYTFEILITNELSDMLISFDAPGYPAIPAYGEVFLAVLGTNIDHQFRNLICLCLLFLGFSVLTCILLLLQVPRSRKNFPRLRYNNHHHDHVVDDDAPEFDA